MFHVEHWRVDLLCRPRSRDVPRGTLTSPDDAQARQAHLCGPILLEVPRGTLPPRHSAASRNMFHVEHGPAESVCPPTERRGSTWNTHLSGPRASPASALMGASPPEVPRGTFPLRHSLSAPPGACSTWNIGVLSQAHPVHARCSTWNTPVARNLPTLRQGGLGTLRTGLWTTARPLECRKTSLVRETRAERRHAGFWCSHRREGPGAGPRRDGGNTVENLGRGGARGVIVSARGGHEEGGCSTWNIPLLSGPVSGVPKECSWARSGRRFGRAPRGWRSPE